jgi:predicted dehydrogenase
MILENAEGIKKQIYFDNPDIEESNAILMELETFADAIENDTRPIVNLEDGTAALDVALKVIENFRSL